MCTVRLAHSMGTVEAPGLDMGTKLAFPLSLKHPPLDLEQRPWTAPPTQPHTHRSKFRDTQIHS